MANKVLMFIHHIRSAFHNSVYKAGADPGFRRGVSYIQKGGGGFVQEFQERIQIVAGPWANQQAKKNCRQP